jgi:hypothetical protein
MTGLRSGAVVRGPTSIVGVAVQRDRFAAGSGQDGRSEAARGAAGAASLDALLPTLSERDLRCCEMWGRVGAGVGGSGVWRRALPVEPNLGSYSDAGGLRPTGLGRFVWVAGRHGRLPAVEARRKAEAPPPRSGRVLYRARR